MPIEARLIRKSDDGQEEEWTRVTDDNDILGVGATRSADSDWPWQVFISVAEFIRENPLESILVQAITRCLRVTPGVTDVIHDDRETWVLRGDISGESLIVACGNALDELEPQTRAAYESLQ
jgi:hypothetical protein